MSRGTSCFWVYFSFSKRLEKSSRKNLSFAKPFLQREPRKHGVVIAIDRIDPHRRQIRKLLGKQPALEAGVVDPGTALSHLVSPVVPSCVAEPLSAPISTGILFSVTVIGPGVAFMLGSAMLRFYVDIDKVTEGECRHLWRAVHHPPCCVNQQQSSPSLGILTPRG